MNTSSIVAEIDAEIARLREARDLIAGVGSTARPGRGRKSRTEADDSSQKAPGRKTPKRHLSAEARERIRQAQIKRWAASKKAAGKRSGSAR